MGVWSVEVSSDETTSKEPVSAGGVVSSRGVRDAGDWISSGGVAVSGDVSTTSWATRAAKDEQDHTCKPHNTTLADPHACTHACMYTYAHTHALYAQMHADTHTHKSKHEYTIQARERASDT